MKSFVSNENYYKLISSIEIMKRAARMGEKIYCSRKENKYLNIKWMVWFILCVLIPMVILLFNGLGFWISFLIIVTVNIVCAMIAMICSVP